MDGLREQRSDSSNDQRDNLLNSLHECDTYKELSDRHTDPEDITSIKQIESTFENLNSDELMPGILQEIGETTDQAILKAFEQVGFSKDYILSHADEFHTEYCPTPDWKTFYHQDQKLFTIYAIREFEQNSSFNLSYRIDFYVLYHVKLKE